MKQTIFYITLYSVFTLSAIYSTYQFCKPTPQLPCKPGVIIDKRSPPNVNVNKNHTTITIKNSMVIKYDNGTYDDINPSEQLFYTRNIGDRVCIEADYVLTSIWRVLGYMMACVVWICHLVMIIRGVYFLIQIFIFDGNKYREQYTWGTWLDLED